MTDAAENPEDWFDEEVPFTEDRGYESFQQSIWKEGYKKGFSDSKDTELQKGFEQSFVKSVELAFPLGELKGKLEALIKYGAPDKLMDKVALARNLVEEIQNWENTARRFFVIVPVGADPKTTNLDEHVQQREMDVRKDVSRFMDQGNVILVTVEFSGVQKT